MVRDQLIGELKNEINRYIGIPYFSNTGKYKIKGDDVEVGKGSAQEIALKTIEYANREKITLLDLTADQIYFFQKKHRLGIDCSGLACHLLNFYSRLLHQPLNLDPRHTNADMLTSLPLAHQINLKDITTADLIRQRQGKHVVFVVEKINDTVTYVESKLLTLRKVKYGQVKLNHPEFFKDSVFRLTGLI